MPMRTTAEIEYDFVALLAGQLPAEVARREFEVLWDESNRALVATLGTAEGEAYLSLLKDMHIQFVKRYGDPARGGAGRGSV
ncbi:conserved protein of unknown function [Pararobbsia alpina]